MSVWSSFARVLGFGEEARRPAASSTEDEPTELEAGHVVGEYVIEQKLGEGGFGAVYRAVHPVIGKAAAVKVLHPQYSSNPEIVSRFVSEARAVNQIRHRHIIDIFSFGCLDDGRHYYVMELLEGVTLDDYLEHTGRLEPAEALPILQAVAKALEAAHDAGIAHRDLKPENIFLAVDDDGTVFPKILDFGVAKLLIADGPGPMHKTHTGTPIGTPRYMSPEQCQGRRVDHRTDIYSLGVIAHRMLTGKLPFEANTALELMLMHVGTPPPRVSETVDGMEAVDAPVLSMLEKDPDDRPGSLTDAFSALLSAAESVGVRPEAMRISIPPEVRESIQAAKTASRRSDRLTPSGVQTPSRRDGAVLARAATAPVSSAGRLWLVVAGVVAVSGVAALLITSRPSPTSPVSPSAAPSAVPANASTGLVVSAATALSVPPPASSAPAAAASVSWTFDTEPKGADVFLGDRPLGQAPGPFLVHRSTDKREVIVKAPGYEDERLDLDATTDRVISVQLKRHTSRPVQPSVPKDLEYPF